MIFEKAYRQVNSKIGYAVQASAVASRENRRSSPETLWLDLAY
jgi:hypothetical protein